MRTLQECALVFNQTVAWGDQDAFGHLNNVMYYRYMESARIAYLNKISALGGDFVTVIASNSCRYLLPVFFPDELSIGVNVVELRNSGFRMIYTIFSAQQNALVATAESVLVMMNAESYEKAALSSDLKDRIIALEAAVGNILPSEMLIPSSRDVIASSKEVLSSSRDVINEISRTVRDTVRDAVMDGVEQILPKMKK